VTDSVGLRDPPSLPKSPLREKIKFLALYY